MRIDVATTLTVSFLSFFGGVAQFRTMNVTATTAGPLPAPDDAPFPLP